MTGSVLKRANTKSKWRRYQSPKHSSSKVHLALLALGLLVILIILAKIVNFLVNLNQPFAPDSSVDLTRASRWDGSSTINLAIQSSDTAVLSFNPVEETAVIIKIPDETYVKLPYGFGLWPIRSVYDLGQAESPPQGAFLLKETLSSVLGIPIDGYLLMADKSSGQVEEMIKGIRSSFVKGLSLVGDSKTDLTAWEFAKLIWSLQGVRSDKVKIIDLGQSKVTTWILLPDGSRALDFDQQILDQFLQDNLSDSKISLEALSIGIYNSTEHAQMAEKAARLVNNIGGRVIFTTNISTHLDQTVVLAQEESYTKKRLAQVFAPKCLNSSQSLLSKITLGSYKPFARSDCAIIVCKLTKASFCSGVKSAEVESNLREDFSRADVNVILGEDFYQKLIERPEGK